MSESQSQDTRYPATTGFTVLAKKNPLAEEILEARAPSGLTIRETIGCDGDFVVSLDWEEVPPELWATTQPQAGQTLFVCPSARGDNAKQLLATAAIIVAAIYTGGAAAAAFQAGGAAATGLSLGNAALWTSGIMAAGSLLLGALTKPPVIEPEAAPRALSSISSVRNRFPHYEPVPSLYGQRKIYPPYAAQPFTEIVGDDQYFNALFCVGIGDHEIESPRIGETALSNYAGIQLTQTKAPAWPDVSEQDLSTELDDPAKPGGGANITQTFTTAPGTEDISVDFMCPAGLIYVRDQGEKVEAWIDFKVEFRVVGGIPWANVRHLTWQERTVGNNIVFGLSGATVQSYVGPLSLSPINPDAFRVRYKKAQGLRFGLKWQASTGGGTQYEVRVTRVAFGQDRRFPDEVQPTQEARQREFDKYIQSFVWTKLRSHSIDSQAINTEGKVDFIQLRIKADDQLNGIIDQFSVIATRKLPRWTPTGGWEEPQPTRNPALAYLDVLMGEGNARAITRQQAPSRIWLDDFYRWGEANFFTHQFYYDDYIEQRSNVLSMLQTIAAAGRAARSMRDTKHSIIREEESQTPTQVITDRNSRNYRFERRFFDPPHAFQVRFPSEDADYQEDEIIVYTDGYHKNNADPAKFETLTFRGVTNYRQAYRFARFHLAQAKFRQRIHYRELDFSHLAALRGDCIAVQSDVMLAALGSGRITQIVGDKFTLDESFVIDSSKSYAAQFYVVDPDPMARVFISPVRVPVGVASRTFEVYPNRLDLRVREGDLVVIGEAATIKVPMKITNITPRSGLSAEISYVDLAPEILTADQGPLPDYRPIITVPVDPERVVPPTPRIVSVHSEPNLSVVMPSGHRAARMIVSYDMGAYAGLPQDQVEVRLRIRTTDGAGAWTVMPRQGVRSASIATLDVEPGETYQIQIRTITAYGTPSAWSLAAEHTVSAMAIVGPAAQSMWVAASPEGLYVVLNIDGVQRRDMSRVEIRVGIEDDKEAESTDVHSQSVPSDFEELEQLSIFIPLSGQARTLYVWARFVDVYANAGPWWPAFEASGFVWGQAIWGSSTVWGAKSLGGGILVQYPGQPVSGFPSTPQGSQFLRYPDGTWNLDELDVLFRFRRAGEEVSTRTVRVMRADDVLIAEVVGVSGEATTHTVVGAGSSSLTIQATHTNSGVIVPQGITAVVSGADGPPGEGLVSYVLSAGMARNGKTFTKISGGAAWDAGFYTTERFGSCIASFQPAQANLGFIIGVNQDPATNHSYETIDYGMYCGGDGRLYAYESGVDRGVISSSYAANDTLTVQYDGSHVRYTRNGFVLRTVPDAGKRFALDASYFGVGASANNVMFTTIAAGQIDLATQVFNKITAAFADAGLLNTNIGIGPDGKLIGAGGGQPIISELAGSVGAHQMTANVVAALQAVIGNLSAIHAELGNAVISTTGSLRSGASAYDGDGGWWLGFSGGEPGLSLRQGAEFIRFKPSTGVQASAVIKATNATDSFLPAWTGFSVTPTVAAYYIDMGKLVFLWFEADAVGTSNANAMTITNLPSAIRPSGIRFGTCPVYNQGDILQGGWEIPSAGGYSTIRFYLGLVAATSGSEGLRQDLAYFATSGTKGVPNGWLIVYPK